MIDKILEILEDSKTVCYEKFPRDQKAYSLSAVLCISPTCIDRIKQLYKLPINEKYNMIDTRKMTVEEMKVYLATVKSNIKLWQKERMRVDNIIRNRGS